MPAFTYQGYTISPRTFPLLSAANRALRCSFVGVMIDRDIVW